MRSSFITGKRSTSMRADLRLLAAITTGLLLAACTPVPGPTPTPTVPDFTVATTGGWQSLDPAVATGQTEAIVIGSTFQRLMMVLPGTGELRPDAATDCLFVSRQVYQCSLPEKLTFHNGRDVRASDVKFSLQRALRFNTPGTSVGLLSALERIEVPDPLTIKFHLAWPDNQFGFALAGQAASIVDPQVFDPDTGLAPNTLPIGSGPLKVSSATPEKVKFTRHAGYLGPRQANLDRICLVILPDSTAAEAAINTAGVDLVWRALDDPALKRLDDEIAASPKRTTLSGFVRLDLPGLNVTRLGWNPASKLRSNATLRTGIARALTPDRTLDSLVPVGVADHVAAFPIGGRPQLPTIPGQRVTLRLGYVASAPGHADLARLIRDRIETLKKVSVRVVTDSTADLQLTDAPAWVGTPGGWLQPYLADPLPGSAEALESLDRQARTSSGSERGLALAGLQRRAASDATWLPVSQTAGIAFARVPARLLPGSIGSAQGLGLWGIVNG